MLLTVILWIVLAIVAFGLRSPWSPRRAVQAAIAGLALGLVFSYFNAYAGSIRGIAMLLALALIVSGVRALRGIQVSTQPLHRAMPGSGVAVITLLVLTGIFPFTSWGAQSVSEPLYNDLNANQVKTSAPALLAATDVRVVPWDLASQLLVRGYGADASWLDTTPMLLQAHTYPDTVNGQFLWVHAPAPETAKWLVGGRTADKVVYVANDATNLTPAVVAGKLAVNIDGTFWQHRVARYAQEAGELRYVLQDVTLQMDDSYHPHWIAYLATLDWRSQPHLVKLLIVDAQTGAEKDYSPEDAPAWVEQVYPESYVYDWAQYWGLHREGFLYRWFNAQGLVQPDDVTVRYIRVENQTYWLLPMKQLSSPNLGGYILVNTRTGAATFYDRFDAQLVDYDTAYTQLQAILASGEATKGAGSIRLTVSEGYIYPIKMTDGGVRDAYIFPLLEGLKVSRFAIIDAQDYNNRRVFASSMQDALSQFSLLTGGTGVTPPTTTNATATPMVLTDGVVTGDHAIVTLNGTVYRVVQTNLADGQRHEAEHEYDELTLAISRAQRGESVTVDVLIDGGRVVDVTLPGVTWGG
ncbi:MAG: hypothetical protein WDA16_14840 [Candidatus Thermoplasmatota archaeon]